MSPQQKEQQKKPQLPGERRVERPLKKNPLDIDEIDEIIERTEKTRKQDQKEGQ